MIDLALLLHDCARKHFPLLYNGIKARGVDPTQPLSSKLPG